MDEEFTSLGTYLALQSLMVLILLFWNQQRIIIDIQLQVFLDNTVIVYANILN